MGDMMLDYEKYMTVSDAIIDEILNHPLCQQYKSVQQELSADQTAKQYIDNFEKAKNAYNDVMRYGGKYHPDYSSVSTQLIQAKTTLYEYPLIKQLKQCEQGIQMLLDGVSYELSQLSEIDETFSKTACNSGGNCSC